MGKFFVNVGFTALGAAGVILMVIAVLISFLARTIMAVGRGFENMALAICALIDV